MYFILLSLAFNLRVMLKNCQWSSQGQGQGHQGLA